eukprot:scaffold388014_cov38-Prasinocladus_malaysianus.AAC.1
MGPADGKPAEMAGALGSRWKCSSGSAREVGAVQKAAAPRPPRASETAGDSCGHNCLYLPRELRRYLRAARAASPSGRRYPSAGARWRIRHRGSSSVQESWRERPWHASCAAVTTGDRKGCSRGS